MQHIAICITECFCRGHMSLKVRIWNHRVRTWVDGSTHLGRCKIILNFTRYTLRNRGRDYWSHSNVSHVTTNPDCMGCRFHYVFSVKMFKTDSSLPLKVSVTLILSRFWTILRNLNPQNQVISRRVTHS